MREDVRIAAAALADLTISRENARASWKMKGWGSRPPKQLNRFLPMGEQLGRQLAEVPQRLLPQWEPGPLILEAYIDERGAVQVLSTGPEPEAPLPALDTPGPPLLTQGDPIEERKRARLKVLRERETELVRRADAEGVAATRLRIAQVEAELGLVDDD